MNTGQLTEDARQYLGEASPPFPGNALGRVGRPDEIGYAVLFFASTHLAFAPGKLCGLTEDGEVNLNLDGGARIGVQVAYERGS